MSNTPVNRGRIAFSHGWIGACAAASLGACLLACGAEDGADDPARPTVLGVGGMSGSGAAGAMGGQGGVQSMGGKAGSSTPPDQGRGMAGAMAGRSSTGMGGVGAAGTTAGTSGSAGSVAPPPTGDLCARWKAARVNLTEGMWTGNTAACEAGDMTPEDRAKAHGLHSLYRQMAGLEPVEMTDAGNRLAQNCALLMAANGTITHTPPSTWTCYTAEAADTANKSSLSSGGAISSVDGYMVDPGNPTTIGHRRWILSNMLASVGYGSAGRFSCQYQPSRRPPAGAKPWVAWPPPGQVPLQAMGTRFATIDSTGWTVQSDSVPLASAQVTVTSGGMDMPVTVTQLGGGYGSTHALRFNPMGWKTAAGQTYSVKLTGTSMPIEYNVEVIDCP